LKVRGVTHYLWRAADHEGEVLESFVTLTRDRKSALKSLKKSMKRHGRPETIITDRPRSYGAALKYWAAAMTARWDGGSTTGLRIRTYRSDDASGRCCGSGACGRYRNSPLSMPRFTTTFQQSATFRTATTSSKPAPPLSPSGAAFSLPDTEVGLG
jgi:hypothetical protein